MILEFPYSNVYNEDKIPYDDMEECCQNLLDTHWKEVETYDRDSCQWIPNRICPRQWSKEAYRLPKSVFSE